MSISSESAEQVTKMLLEGTEVTLKVTGKASKELIVLIYAIMKENQKTKGKTTLTNMLKSGKPLEVFSINKEQLPTFMEEAKRYGILYTALVSKMNKDIDGMVDVLVKSEDAARINRIVERFELTTVNTGKIKSEVKNSPLISKNQSGKQSEKSKVQEVAKKSVKEDLVNAKVEANKINKERVIDKIKDIIKEK